MSAHPVRVSTMLPVLIAVTRTFVNVHQDLTVGSLLNVLK